MRLKFAALLVVMSFGLSGYHFYPEDKLQSNILIDKLVIFKSDRKLLAYSDGKLIKTYTVALGRNPVGGKEYEGDCKTPEGFNVINTKSPNSSYHKNLGISYPNAEDIKQARKLGKSPGGAIKIHGIRNGAGMVGKLHRWLDWTQGCVAVTDEEIDELYAIVAVGTPIEIKP